MTKEMMWLYFTLFVDTETQISYSFLPPHSIILLVIFFQAFKKK